MEQPIIRVDALLPAEIAERASEVGVKKANLPIISMFVLAVLAGGFVSLGALFATVSTAGASGILPYGLIRVLFGLVFCLGLVLVILAGAELFTGNTLIIMAWASRKITTRALARDWIIVYTGNMLGSLATASLVLISHQYSYGSGSVGQAALTIANTKASIEFIPALASGILCNALVCMAVWLTLGARTTTDKILAIIFPIAGFAAAGFEHSIANMYFIPIGLLIKQFDPAFVAKLNMDLTNLTVGGFVSNLVPVTIGNILGGGVMVAAVYWFIYLRKNHAG